MGKDQGERDRTMEDKLLYFHYVDKQKFSYPLFRFKFMLEKFGLDTASLIQPIMVNEIIRRI